jgi:peptide/nickel transport system permease protein
MAESSVQVAGKRLQAVIPDRKADTRATSRRFPAGVALLLPLMVFLGVVLFGYLDSESPTAQHLADRLQEPGLANGSTQHVLGTDSLGREMLARVATGARLSLLVGLAATGVSAVIGIALGLAAGLRGGAVDVVATALGEITLSIPTIVLGIVVVSTLGPGMTNLIFLLTVTGWIGFARVVRLQGRALAGAEFVLAARSMGASERQVAVRHILPNLLPVVTVVLCQQIAAVMIWEASLTYLGIGMPIERISLGGLVREGQEHVFTAWWISFFPGLAIALAVIGFNLLADWLQGRLDPRRR